MFHHFQNRGSPGWSALTLLYIIERVKRVVPAEYGRNSETTVLGSSVPTDKRAFFEIKRSGNDPLHYVIIVDVNDRTNKEEIKAVALDALSLLVDTASPDDLIKIDNTRFSQMHTEKVTLALHDAEVFRVL